MAPPPAGISPARTLTSVDLPAPLVPITACTSARTRDSDTRSTARSPPKLRETSVAVSSVSGPITCGPAVAACPCEQADDALREQRDTGDDRESQRQLPVLRERAEQRLRLEQFLQHDECEGAQHCAAQAPRPAE